MRFLAARSVFSVTEGCLTSLLEFCTHYAAAWSSAAEKEEKTELKLVITPASFWPVGFPKAGCASQLSYSSDPWKRRRGESYQKLVNELIYMTAF